MKKILYVRVSNIIGNTDRQKINEDDYDKVFEDKCSGAISFQERPAGKKLWNLVSSGANLEVDIHSISRSGRNTLDILQTIKHFTENGVRINFIKEGLSTLDDDGKVNPVSKMIIGIMGTLAEMEREQIRERTREGIELAKLKGKYKGRKSNSTESVSQFLSKPKSIDILNLLEKGIKPMQISRMLNTHPKTIRKVRRLGLEEAVQ